jgi:hypothetical protein
VRRYNEFSGLWRAPLFNKTFYQDVALNWRGIGARFLLLLVMLTWLAYLIEATFLFNGFIAKDMQGAFADFPKITISKGVASSDVKQPYVIKDEQGKPVFVFDTTGEVTQPDRNGPMLVMTRTELIQMDSMGNVQRHPLSQIPDMVIDRQWLMSWVYVARNMLIPGGLACCGGGTFGLRLLLALGLAAIGLALNSGFHGGLSFQALIRLSVVSMAGPVLVETILWLVGIHTGCWGLPVFTAAAFGYLVFAVKVGAQVVKAAVAYTNLPPGMPPLPREGDRPPGQGDADEQFP